MVFWLVFFVVVGVFFLLGVRFYWGFVCFSFFGFVRFCFCFSFFWLFLFLLFCFLLFCFSYSDLGKQPCGQLSGDSPRPPFWLSLLLCGCS